MLMTRNTAGIDFTMPEPMARALTGDAATDPMSSLASLLDHAAERGIVLQRGDLVTTGAMCKPFRLQGTGQELGATFAGGSLRFHLETRR